MNAIATRESEPKEARQAAAENESMRKLAAGITEAAWLIAERYRRRAPKERAVNVNLPPGAGAVQPALDRNLPSPYQSPLLGKARGSELMEVEHLRQQARMTEGRRRQLVAQYQESKLTNPQIAPVGNIVSFVAQRVRGATAHTAPAATVSKPAPAQTGARGATMQPLTIKDRFETVEINLNWYQPYCEIQDLFSKLESAGYERSGGRPGEDSTIPYYLSPDILLLEVAQSIPGYFPIVDVPKSSSQAYVREVQTKPPLLSMAKGLIMQLRKRLREVEKYPRTGGPEGGGSIRV